MSFFVSKDMSGKSYPPIQENSFFRFISAAFETFIFSNIFISLSAVTLTLSSYLILFNFDYGYYSIHLISLVFFSTFFIYNFHIFSFLNKNESTKREKWISKNKKLIKTLSLIALAGISYNIFFLSVYQISFLIHLACLSFLYIVPLEFNNFKFSLREFSLVKIFVLAYVWASATVILPAMETDKFFHYETYIVFFERFIFIFALAIPFDIRDYSKDKSESLKTIPGKLGINKAKNLSVIILLFYILFSFFMRGIDDVTISRIFSGLIAIFLIRKIDETASDSYYMFWIDGVMVFHFLILSLLHIFV